MNENNIKQQNTFSLKGFNITSSLLITCSASGNYAIATKNNVKDVKAQKFLITLNHAKKFKEYYDTMIYLSDKFQSSEYISNGMQNVYTRYGINYFFDLLFNNYVQKYLI